MAFSTSPFHAPQRRRILYIVVLLALLIAGGVGILALRLAEAANDAFDRVTQSNSIIASADRVLSSLITVETGERGYLLTHQATYLDSYKRDYAAVNQRLVELRELTGGDLRNRNRIDELTVLVADKLAEVEKTMRIADISGIPAAIDFVGTNQGKHTMDAIRQVLGFIQRDERQRFYIRQLASRELAARYQAGTILVVIVEILLISSVLFLLGRRLRELESLITVCAWTKRVKYKGEWVSFEKFLEDRYHLRFTHGISEEALRWQMENQAPESKKPS